MKIYISGYNSYEVILIHNHLLNEDFNNIKIEIISDGYIPQLLSEEDLHSAVVCPDNKKLYEKSFSKNMEKLAEADLFILITDSVGPRQYLAGCFVEAGIAYTLDMHFILYGPFPNRTIEGMGFSNPDENFLYQVNTVEDLVTYIKEKVVPNVIPESLKN